MADEVCDEADLPLCVLKLAGGAGICDVLAIYMPTHSTYSPV